MTRRLITLAGWVFSLYAAWIAGLLVGQWSEYTKQVDAA